MNLTTASDQWLDGKHVSRAITSAAMNAIWSAARRLSDEAAGGVVSAQDLAVNMTLHGAGLPDLAGNFAAIPAPGPRRAHAQPLDTGLRKPCRVLSSEHDCRCTV